MTKATTKWMDWPVQTEEPTVERRIHDLIILVLDLKHDADDVEGNKVLRQNFRDLLVTAHVMNDLMAKLSPIYAVSA